MSTNLSHINSGLSLIPNLLQIVSSLADDVLDELLKDGHGLLVVALLLQTTGILISGKESSNYQFLGDLGELGEDGVDLGLVAANVHHIGVLIRIGQG